MTRLTKNFIIKVKDDVEPQTAFNLGMFFAGFLFASGNDENGLEKLKDMVDKMKEVELILG